MDRASPKIDELLETYSSLGDRDVERIVEISQGGGVDAAWDLAEQISWDRILRACGAGDGEGAGAAAPAALLHEEFPGLGREDLKCLAAFAEIAGIAEARKEAELLSALEGGPRAPRDLAEQISWDHILRACGAGDGEGAGAPAALLREEFPGLGGEDLRCLAAFAEIAGIAEARKEAELLSALEGRGGAAAGGASAGPGPPSRRF